jgi:hypothetical protein
LPAQEDLAVVEAVDLKLASRLIPQTPAPRTGGLAAVALDSPAAEHPVVLAS